MPTIQSLLNSQGYTPQQQSTITQQRLGASNTAFDVLREKAANRTAATNNSAGYGDMTAQPGREQAQTDASQAQQNQISFANQKLKKQLAGSALGRPRSDGSLAVWVPPTRIAPPAVGSGLGNSRSNVAWALSGGKLIAVDLFFRGRRPKWRVSFALGMEPESFTPQINVAPVAPKTPWLKKRRVSMGITTFMRELIDPDWWTVALTSLVQFVLFLRWLYRRIRRRNDAHIRRGHGHQPPPSAAHLPAAGKIVRREGN